MSDYSWQIETAIRATSIIGPTTFTWFGEPSPRLPPAARRLLTPDTARDYLRVSLQRRLYRDFYCPGRPVPVYPAPSGPPVHGLTGFVRQLSEANQGEGTWQSGWQIESVEEDRLRAVRDGLSMMVPREDCRVIKGRPLTPGTTVELHLAKELLAASPGYYIAVGNTDLDFSVSEGIVRVYWNISPAGAAELIRRVTAHLNRLGLPFRFKVLNDPLQFRRCDAAVLYLSKQGFAYARHLLARVADEVRPFLHFDVPALTKRLARGVAVAEDPAGPDSFGMHRCGLLAEAIITAHEHGARTIGDRLSVVNASLRQSGIDLDHPYLNPGSDDPFTWPVAASSNVLSNRESEEPELPAARFLETAEAIASALCHDALWHGERCTWLGQLPSAQGASTFRSLPPDLYDGVTGVALFLAEAFAATGYLPAKETALGAIRQAVSICESISPPQRQSLFGGWTGIAASSARIAVLINDSELMPLAIGLMDRALEYSLPGEEFDVISGRAGAIAGLLMTCKEDGPKRFLEAAGRLGEEMLAVAIKGPDGMAWRTPGALHERDLVGFAHGASGAGFALAQLYNATGEGRFVDAAVSAFKYGDAWFSEREKQWPDFRGVRRRASRHSPSVFASGWCHGPSGNLLARLHAHDLIGDSVVLLHVSEALESTQRLVEDALVLATPDTSLCHGLAGNGDLLLSGTKFESTFPNSNAALASKAASLMSRTWRQTGSPADNPGLMTGLAGLGYFLLRTLNPSLPSVLLPGISGLHGARKE